MPSQMPSRRACRILQACIKMWHACSSNAPQGLLGCERVAAVVIPDDHLRMRKRTSKQAQGNNSHKAAKPAPVSGTDMCQAAVPI